MPEDATVTTEPSLSEVVQTIVIDNREIPITEAPKVLKDLESSLRGDYTRKAQENARERDQNKLALKADIDWFNTHDQRLWNLYSPTVEGGAGYMGTEAQLREIVDNEPDVEPVRKTKNAFETDPEIKTLRDRLAGLEAKQAKIEEGTFATERDRVLSQKTSFLTKYPNASDRAVLKELGLFFMEKQRHPTSQEIEGVVKAHHDDVTKIIARNQKGKEGTGLPTGATTTTPAVSGKAPESGKEKKVLRFDHEPEALVNKIFGRMGGSG